MENTANNKSIKKKIIAMGMVATILVSNTPSFLETPVYAATQTVTKYTVNASSLNVRKGAGTKYGVLGSVKRNATLTVKKKMSNGWYQIDFKGKTGYVSGDYVKKSTSKVSTSTSTKTSSTKYKYTVTASELNVRKGAGTKYGTLGKVKKNAELNVKKQESNGWYQIDFKGKTGYVSGSYVKKSNASSTSSNTSTPSATKLLNVPLIKQRPELPSGCEATALAMALKYYGQNVSKTTIANQMPRDKTAVKRYSDGTIKIWGDPEVGFVGDPYGNGITINPAPLKKVLDKYRKGGVALYGKNFSVVEDYVKKGKPTLVWFTTTHEMPTKRTWKTTKGKTVQAPRPLHCIVVTGVDSKYVYFNDGESNKNSGKNVKVEKSKFIKIYDAMGKRALVVN
jgi:uncharacterized protein YvpB/SH3-like domain-containing protein